MARTRSTQTIADQLDSLVEELKDEVAAEVTPEVTESPADVGEAATEVTPEAIEVDATDVTPSIVIIEPAEPEEAPMSATTLAEIEAGRAALARKA